MTLPFLVHNPRPRQVSQSERSKPRPPLRGSPNRIDTVFKEVRPSLFVSHVIQFLMKFLGHGVRAQYSQPFSRAI